MCHLPKAGTVAYRKGSRKSRFEYTGTGVQSGLWVKMNSVKVGLNLLCCSPDFGPINVGCWSYPCAHVRPSVTSSVEDLSVPADSSPMEVFPVDVESF